MDAFAVLKLAIVEQVTDARWLQESSFPHRLVLYPYPIGVTEYRYFDRFVVAETSDGLYYYTPSRFLVARSLESYMKYARWAKLPLVVDVDKVILPLPGEVTSV